MLSVVTRRCMSSSASKLPQTVDLLDRYRALVTLGKIQYDEEQVRVVMKLRRLQRELYEYTPNSVSHLLYTSIANDRDGDQMWWIPSHVEDHAVVPYRGTTEYLIDLESPKGLLLTGPPGSGKSFLVDLWFSGLPTPYKTRKHYSQLVLEIYRAVWEETRRRMPIPSRPSPAKSTVPWTRTLKEQWKDLVKTGSLPTSWPISYIASLKESFGNVDSAHPPMAYTIARRLLLSHYLLVFDELQLQDVSSASLLADVLSWFWRLGGVVVATSNRVPEDLYKNGVQKERLEGFVEALRGRCPVLEMGTGEENARDWREVRGAVSVGARTWYTRGQDEEFQKFLTQDSLGSQPTSQDLDVFGRKLHVSWVRGDVAKFAFNELCNESLGPADYLTLASTFRTLVITDIPVLPLSAKNQARRFISLIDALYEARCRLVCLADCEPQDMFFPETLENAKTQSHDDSDVMLRESVAETGDVYRPNVSSYDAPDMQDAPASRVLALDTLSIFSGKDEQFAFKRALSRLIEMTSSEYALNEVWNPLPASERKWEGISEYNTAKSPPLSQRARDSPHSSLARDDFAEEAAYESATPNRRPEPPTLKSDHVWGVRDDWGEGAKVWGRGARAYQGKTESQSKAA